MQGQFATNLGNQIYNVAMLLLIKELTGSAAIMGLTMLLTSLPEVLLAPFGGKVADRFGRVRTIVASDLFSTFAVSIVLLTVLFDANSTVVIAALCLSNLFLGLAASCFNPAVSALVPVLVPESELEQGNAAHQFSRTGGQLLGQSAAGLLLSFSGVVGTFLCNAISFFASAVMESRIRVPNEHPTAARRKHDKSLYRETVELLYYVMGATGLRSLLLYIAVFHLCLSCLPILLPFRVEHSLHISDSWFGFFVAAYTGGTMLGFVVSGLVKPHGDRFRLIAAAGMMVGVLLGGLAAISSPALAWLVLLGVGVGIGVIVVNLITELQLSSREADRGAIMGIAQAVGGCSLPIGMALTGILLDALHGQGISYARATDIVLLVSATAAVLASTSALVNGRKTK